ncbi:MAG: K(+)-transporting ATPase subunit C [Verrucomicrobia bacterium]|nr:K(+)-transporting ATPase subunit C [Verrucomicrobiota bacterium]MBU6446255.1 K(+)-transporting ATPase subunit C [Verrucomicrobiota bacterium]
MKPFKMSVIVLGLFTLLMGIIYPLIIWAVGQILFHDKANGTLVYGANHDVVGSAWIAQNFTSDRYFHPRPSAAKYDGASSTGSNLGPTSQKFIEQLKTRVQAYRLKNNWTRAIPADAVTASGSGLDPHISVENARIQSTRIAAARGLSQDKVEQLIREYTESPAFRIFGEPRVNVLLINLALDESAPRM